MFVTSSTCFVGSFSRQVAFSKVALGRFGVETLRWKVHFMWLHVFGVRLEA